MMPVTGGTINMMEYLLQGKRRAGRRAAPSRRPGERPAGRGACLPAAAASAEGATPGDLGVRGARGGRRPRAGDGHRLWRKPRSDTGGRRDEGREGVTETLCPPRRRKRFGPEPGEPAAPPARPVRQHGARDLSGPRDGVPAEGAAGQPLRAAGPAVHGQKRDALAPALPGPAGDRRQEPPRAGAQLRGHRHIGQPDGLSGGDGLPHGPRVCGQRARVPQGHHEDRGVQDLPHPNAGKHRKH